MFCPQNADAAVFFPLKWKNNSHKNFKFELRKLPNCCKKKKKKNILTVAHGSTTVNENDDFLKLFWDFNKLIFNMKRYFKYLQLKQIRLLHVSINTLI